MFQFIKKLLVTAISVILAIEPTLASKVSVRIKDIVTFEGVRENQLVGYGLVVGLNGSGDTVASLPYTKESLTSMLERLGVNIRNPVSQLGGKNIAAVMVTATLPPFVRQGSRIDVTVSAMGDAKDLRGGTLLVTPLLGADGDVYAVAQGPLSVGGFNISGKSGSQVTKGVPTSANISSGAIVEKEVGFELASLNHMRLNIRNPDFTTAKRVADTINKNTHGTNALAEDPSTIRIELHNSSRRNIVDLMTRIEQLRVTPDQTAKIIIDDQDGVIVMGEHVRVSTVAITHGSVTIHITETPQVSQPNPFTQVQTATQVDRTDISVKEEKGKLAILPAGVSIQELVNGLNALGITARDMIIILRSIKAAGALQADIEVI